jgi:hypothetical protein
LSQSFRSTNRYVTKHPDFSNETPAKIENLLERSEIKKSDLENTNVPGAGAPINDHVTPKLPITDNTNGGTYANEWTVVTTKKQASRAALTTKKELKESTNKARVN